MADRVVRIFRNGRNQAVRIPRDMELPGKQAVIRKEGNVITLVPKQALSLLATLKTLGPISEDFEVEDLPAEDVDL
jgi:antitoxin VapB